ncbi:hypothetical protein JCGZ_20400 [Jatropha curcas]|nr:hypothetical protein JCGZ_20400 [Jatropha curcas]
MNYLRPDIKRGNITSDEDDLIIRLHSLLGNRWSLIAGRLPGRTDNEIKNYWNSHLSKRIKHTSTTKDKCLVSSSDQPTNKIKKGNNYQEPATPNGETNKKMNKIYIPKAVRVSSAVSFTRTKSFNSNMGSGSSNHLPWSWSDLEGEALPSINNYYKDDYVYGCVSSSQTYMPMTNDDKMLDGIFEEYERLLKKDNIAHLDSFIDSLLA